MNRKYASAKWRGNLESGGGTIQMESTSEYNGYTADSRFGPGKGNSPEELIAAAHAACFSMALAHLLSEKVMIPQQVATTATVSIEEDGDGFSITCSELVTHVNGLGLDGEKLQAYAEQAKDSCPVSKALSGVQITVEAILEKTLTPEEY
ncbi:OsmC family peroxiredoxin [Pontiellaceae bacterium B1224]|nr:OsmC family peroxiredoxin [Pontiellaceae bacterium B1224]